MDPSLFWADLFKLSPVFAIMGAIIWYLAGQLKEERAENRKSQELRLAELKEANAVYNKYSVQMDTVIETMKNIPEIIARNQERLIDALDDFKREFRK